MMMSSADCKRQVQQKYYHDRDTAVLPSLVPGQLVPSQNQTTLEWMPVVVPDKAEEVFGVLCSQATPSGKELRRNRSQIRQIPKHYPKQVKFDLKRDQLCSFFPEIDLTINKQSQPNPGSSPGPVSPAAQPISSNPEAAKL